MGIFLPSAATSFKLAGGWLEWYGRMKQAALVSTRKRIYGIYQVEESAADRHDD